MKKKLFSNELNFNLTIFSGEIEDDIFKEKSVYELHKFNFAFSKGIRDHSARKALVNEQIWYEDEASVVLQGKEYRLRLPKGKGHYSPKTMRSVREVESERLLANIHGSFYEVPLYKVGEEPLYKMMRPVATHNRQILDYNTWNGLLLMSGVKADAKSSEHIIKDNTYDIALWMGGIDDIWKFGKPVGEGGPWKNAIVKKDEISDMYLMTGYDRKTLKLTADKDAKIDLYVYIAHYYDKPVLYKSLSIKSGETIIHMFLKGYNAHLIQLKSDTDCRITAWFIYE